MTKRYLSRGELENSALSPTAFNAGVVVFEVEHTDLERVHPPESVDEAAQRHERLWIHHFTEYQRLTGKEPRDHGLSADDLRCLGQAAAEWMSEPLSENPTAAEGSLCSTLSDLLATGKLVDPRSRAKRYEQRAEQRAIAAGCRTWTSPSIDDFTGACSRCGRLPEEHR